MMFRIFENPDGSLRILHPNPRRRAPGETDASFIIRIGSEAVTKDPTLSGLPFRDIDAADIPANRADRHKWRLVAAGPRTVVRPDPAIPDRPSVADVADGGGPR